MKTKILKIALPAMVACVLATGSALAQTYTVSDNYSIGTAVPDNNPSGLAESETFSAPGITAITSLTVSLDISGGVNGDYYAYLAYGSGFSVLLNRVGKDAGDPTGYGDSGLNVTLADGVANGDIHVYELTLNPEGGALTGTWAPDGRTADPSVVTTSSPQLAPLSSFNGLNPNGNWTLFVADMDPGGVGTLESFALNVTGVPEPGTCALLALGGAGLLLGRRRGGK
jgi:subtilisin-like proprotein convertase family protein